MDRNPDLFSPLFGVNPSLSARRAWIEISLTSLADVELTVALRKESVDRNV